MTVRQIIGFENNPVAMDLLRENYKERREIDQELGIECSVRLFTAVFAGPNAGRMSIQYEFENMAAVEEAQAKRIANERWVELNQGLNEAGFQVIFHAISLEQTPE